MKEFEFKPAPWLPFANDVEMLERLRTMTREEMEVPLIMYSKKQNR